MSAAKTAANKIIRCIHCNGMMRVAARAISVACPHCQKRITIEDLHIRSVYPSSCLATCGSIFIEPTAKLNLELKATNIYINGRVRGPVCARNVVEIGPQGQVIGDIRAAKIIVRDGGRIEGRCEMVRPAATQSKPPVPTVPANGSGAAAGVPAGPNGAPARPQIAPGKSA